MATTATQTFNSYLEGTGYSIVRKGVYFNLYTAANALVVGFRRTIEMQDYLGTMALSCSLPETAVVETLSDEVSGLSVEHINGDQTMINYGCYCEPLLTPVELSCTFYPYWRIIESERGMGYIVEFDGYMVGEAPSWDVAMIDIRSGIYITPGERCDLPLWESPPNEFGTTEIVYNLLDLSLLQKGYPLSECWVDAETGSVYTLEGDHYMGDISELYRPETDIPAMRSYLTEAEFESSAHLMEF